jgi:hypothetical protein
VQTFYRQSETFFINSLNEPPFGPGPFNFKETPVTIRIALSASQGNLLLKYESDFADHDLFRLVSAAIEQGKGYEISLDEDELEALQDQVCEIANHESNAKTQKQLDALCDYLEDFYDDFDEDDADYSEHSSITGAVCILKVALPCPEEIWRTIAIREGQTLHDLHENIFEAFDRYDEHLYSFFFPHSCIKNFDVKKICHKSDQYTHPCVLEDQGVFESKAQDASTVSIGTLNLKKGQLFYYLFDFGDDWWHQITVDKTGDEADDGTYPRIVERKGESPEQYPDPDEEEIG